MYVMKVKCKCPNCEKIYDFNLYEYEWNGIGLMRKYCKQCKTKRYYMYNFTPRNNNWEDRRHND